MVKVFKKVKNALMQSAKGVFFVLQKPKYFILAIIFSFLLSLIIYFSIIKKSVMKNMIICLKSYELVAAKKNFKFLKKKLKEKANSEQNV